jgi:hypothetical protein
LNRSHKYNKTQIKNKLLSVGKDLINSIINFGLAVQIYAKVGLKVVVLVAKIEYKIGWMRSISVSSFILIKKIKRTRRS